MILSQPDLRAAVDKGEIVFDPPLQENQWGEASVDLRLGHQFTRFRKLKSITVSVADGLGELGDLDLWDTETIETNPKTGKRGQCVLEPGDFVLALTLEKITVPNHLIGLIEGRSTYARIGLSMHETAPWIQPGWKNTPIILEIRNNGQLNIALTPEIDKPCQLSFLRLTTPLPTTLAYGSRPTDRYQDQDHPLKHNR
jgi:dCTP deaminase